jgi:hypothetical protein
VSDSAHPPAPRSTRARPRTSSVAFRTLSSHATIRFATVRRSPLRFRLRDIRTGTCLRLAQGCRSEVRATNRRAGTLGAFEMAARHRRFASRSPDPHPPRLDRPALSPRGTRESAAPIGTSAPCRAKRHCAARRSERRWQAKAQASQRRWRIRWKASSGRKYSARRGRLSRGKIRASHVPRWSRWPPSARTYRSSSLSSR